MKDYGEDLSVRARRGELDEGATRQLALLLSGSLEARLAHRAGCEFDAQDSVLPGDEALAQRITERLLVTRPVAPPLPRRWLKPALTAGAIAVLALTAPLLLRERGHAPSSSRTAAPALTARVSTPGATSTESTASVVASAPPASAPPASAPESAPGPSPAKTSARKSAAAPSPLAFAADTSDSASALFVRANRARREADPKRAVALYERLQERYPTAPEALASALALGMLKLQLDQPEAALWHFSAYLARTPQGELGSEALWGQARAYLALGQPDLARKSLRLLLSRYPESAYAGAARAKLQALP